MAIRKTSLQVIKDFINVHHNRYDYSKVEYVNSSAHITIICKTHGPFRQMPRAHLSGQGCSKCTQSENWRSGKSTLDRFIQRAVSIHGDRYSYYNSNYKGSNQKITVTCKIHGDFSVKANAHLNGNGCPKCSNNKLKTNAQFISESQAKHGFKYDYSLVQYLSSTTPVLIICPSHGKFKQRPVNHIAGQGCKKCGVDRSASIITGSCDDFIAKSIKVHGNLYDYTDVEYVRATIPVKIKCRKHGVFLQRPRDHVNSSNGCPKCSNNQTKTTGEFITEANLRWSGRYIYDHTDYKNSKTNVTITCRKHGDFNIAAGYHLARGGCPTCSLSSDQYDLSEFIKSAKPCSIILNDRTTIKPFELDIYIPDHKLAIELNGNYWHSYESPETHEQRMRHSLKCDKCSSIGIKLLQFTDAEWSNKKEIVKSMILNNLQLSSKIHARKCAVDDEPPNQQSFFNTNHLYGHRPGSVSINLNYKDETVAAINFIDYKDGRWEICRFATKLNHCVVGGLSRLLQAFIKIHKPKTIMTYADRRFSSGIGYMSCGFKLIKITKPNYCYLDCRMNVLSRQKCQKHKLPKLLPVCDPDLSESQNMFNNG